MNPRVSRALAVIRILIGIGFLCLGISMLMDQDLLFGGLLRRLYETGGPMRFYNSLFLRVAEFRETLVVYLASGVSIVLGLLYVTGTLFSLASVGAAVFVANIGMASSSQNRPREFMFFVATLLLLMPGRACAGLTWGVDGLLIRRFQDWLVLFPLRRKAPK